MRKLLSSLLLGALGLCLVLFVTAPAASSASRRSSASASASGAASKAQIAEGRLLFDETCSTCHGLNAGGSALAPNLRGLGAATVDLWVSSGWMPLATPTAQPQSKPPKFDEQQTRDIAAYVQSLTPGQGVPIPTVDLKHASLSEGFDLFSLNCAPCHTITGAGDALSNGLTAPPLHGLRSEQVAEAVMTGPGNMPRFHPGALTTAQVMDVVDYVTKVIEHPRNPGGVGLGGVGPVAEGFIGLFVGVGACMLVALWIGEREHEEKHETPGPEDHEVAHV